MSRLMLSGHLNCKPCVTSGYPFLADFLPPNPQAFRHMVDRRSMIEPEVIPRFDLPAFGRIMTDQALAHRLHQRVLYLLFTARPSDHRPLCFSKSRSVLPRVLGPEKNKLSGCLSDLRWRAQPGLAQSSSDMFDFSWSRNACYKRRWGHQSWCVVPAGDPTCCPGALKFSFLL